MVAQWWWLDGCSMLVQWLSGGGGLLDGGMVVKMDHWWRRWLTEARQVGRTGPFSRPPKKQNNKNNCMNEYLLRIKIMLKPSPTVSGMGRELHLYC